MHTNCCFLIVISSSCLISFLFSFNLSFGSNLLKCGYPLPFEVMRGNEARQASLSDEMTGGSAFKMASQSQNT